jgi:hypothetical protein
MQLLNLATIPVDCSYKNEQKYISNQISIFFPPERKLMYEKAFIKRIFVRFESKLTDFKM